MRIQRTNFLLSLEFKDSDNVSISAYDTNFEPMLVEQQGNKINILTPMPNRVMLVLTQGSAELVNMSLAGIAIDKDILLNLIEYKPNRSTESKMSIQDYLNNPSTKLPQWNQGGCVLFDLFNPNPFAYHMLIGNRIKF